MLNDGFKNYWRVTKTKKNHPRVKRGVFHMRAKPLLLAVRVQRVNGSANRVSR